jgi:hypothetical protein
MTDLISREAAIAVLTERKNECPLESVQRYVMAAAIEALTNMPSAEHVLPKTYEEIHKQSLDRRGRPVRENPTRDNWVVIP